MNSNTYSNQRGVALVVSLIILVSLTMLGLTSIQRTTTDLAMAGNQRESGITFQAAEIGLHASENFITASTSNNDYNNSALGLMTVVANDTSQYSPNYFDDTTWMASAQAATTSLISEFGVQGEPRYMIEYLGDRLQNPHAESVSASFGGYGAGQTGDIVSIYRSTARGVGLTGNSFRFVQSYFGKKAP